MVAKLTAFACLVAAAVVTASAGANRMVSPRWQPSHGSEGGPAFSVAIAPSAPETVYVGTRRGVFRSTDGGRSWVSAGLARLAAMPLDPQGGPAQGVTSLVVDPRVSTTVYAGLNGRWVGGIAVRRPVFKSTNGGRSWRPLPLRGQPIAISPANPGTVFAAAGGANGTSRLFRSSDGGRSWQPADGGLPSTYDWSIAFDPKAPATAYAAMGTDGIFASSDGGASWHSLHLTRAAQSVTAIAVDSRHPSTLYAGAVAGVLKSLDGGHSWRVVNTRMGSHGRDRWYGQVSGLVVDPLASRTVYATTVCTGIFKSADGGHRWAPANAGLEPNCKWAMADPVALDPQAPQTLYAADSRGVFKSFDGGAHWRAINNGLSLSTVFSIAVDPKHAGTAYAAAEDLGLFKTTDRGADWRSLASGPKLVNQVTLDPNDPRNILAVAPGYGVVRSSDGGHTWSGASLGAGVRSTRVVAISGGTAYAGGLRLFGSKDGGRSWRNVALSVLEGHGPGVVQALAIAPAQPAVVYAGIAGYGTTDAGGLYRSGDGGINWQHLTTADVGTIALDPTRPAILYIAGGGGVLRTTNGGTTWQPASSGLPRRGFVTTLAIDPAHPATLYAIDYRRGVFRTTNSGRTWNALNAGLSTLDVRSLAVDATGRTVYAGTEGGGVVTLHTER